MAARDKYQTLTLADLSAARDTYQVHLARLPNVVGTALGLYRERDDPSERGLTPAARRDRAPSGRPERTLANSRFGANPWPCVLVFVSHWMTPAEIRRDPDHMVPRELYLPDGRTVPTCVVLAEPVMQPADPVATLSFPTALIGGGYACESVVQSQTRTGTIACLVSDGDVVSALTNRHVAGDPGRELFTHVRGSAVRIGTSAGRSIGHMPLGDAHRTLPPGARTELRVDAGLIALDDVEHATAQVFGFGRLGRLVDVDGADELSLALVGQDVKAFSGASGELTGEILAIAYRYKSLAGTDYLADVLIGPRPGGRLPTRHGDSGTLWVADGAPLRTRREDPPRPIALQWGGQPLGDATSPYVLATFLSTALSALDVDLVTDFNTGLPEYWGPIGHYTIGGLACDLVRPAAWKAFMVANRPNIAFEQEDIKSGAFDEQQRLYVPLADVPDRVWKRVLVDTLVRRGVRKRGREGPNHHADIDQPLPGADPPETLMDDYRGDPTALTPALWNRFYDQIPGLTASDHGLLPFRVAQVYREAVAALRSGDILHGVSALGVMAHYIGDACQPLHGSMFHDGRPGARRRGTHAAYEDDMVGDHIDDLSAGLASTLRGARLPRPITGHQAAARATMDLMLRTREAIPPLAICDAWQAAGATPDTLWTEFGQATIAVMADGCRTLAMLWSSAFAESRARAPAAAALRRDDITDLIVKPDFCESMTLPIYEASGLW